MVEMDKSIRQALLFDHYGSLLTEYQQRIYKEVIFDDYSISEVAQDEGVTRQGISDMIKRCDKMLESYEMKLGLAKRYIKTKQYVEDIISSIEKYKKDKKSSHIDHIADISEKILDL